jgi:hypothetical protein
MSELHVWDVWRDEISLISIDVRFELFTKWSELSLIIIIRYNQALLLISLKWIFFKDVNQWSKEDLA